MPTPLIVQIRVFACINMAPFLHLSTYRCVVQCSAVQDRYCQGPCAAMAKPYVCIVLGSASCAS